MKTNRSLPLWIVGLFILLAPVLSAQPAAPLFDNWETADKDAIEALVLYPRETRDAILKATQYPELLIKIESLQQETSTAFQDLISPFDQEGQTMIYDLSRYPGLVSRLALAAEIDARTIEDILQNYPEVIHERARKVYRDHGALLMEIDRLHLTADHQFNVLIAFYPQETREAYHQLIELPEVLSLLTENIRMTILVGDLYRKTPEMLLSQMDSLNLVVAEANARELENWQKSVESDPEVMTELRSASQEFGETYGYDDVYYSYDDMYTNNRGSDDRYVVEQYFYYNYPYWFGVPSWYYYPRWRPYPVWYESGFYAVLDGTFVVHRLPSFYFTFWYFHRPQHHYYYPHLSRNFVRHTYYGPRPGSSSIAVSVRSWQKRNRDLITENWLRDDRNSIQRFREYGKFEIDRNRYNRKKIEKELSPSEYLNQHRNKYPELIRAKTERTQTVKPQRSVPNPEVSRPDQDQRINPSKRKTNPTIERNRTPVMPRSRIVIPKKDVPKLQRGTDQHRRTIERSKVTRPQVMPRTVPKVNPRTIPRAQPKVLPKTKKPRTKKGGGG